MANPSRGEIEITIGDRTYTVRPTFQIIREIENVHGSLFKLARAIAEGEFSMTNVVGLMFIILRRQDSKLKLEDLGEAMMEEGLTSFVMPIAQFLTNAVNPDSEGVKGSPAAGESRQKMN